MLRTSFDTELNDLEEIERKSGECKSFMAWRKCNVDFLIRVSGGCVGDSSLGHQEGGFSWCLWGLSGGKL